MGIMEHHIRKDDKAGVLNFILIWTFFYIELLQGGIATHDELYAISSTIEGNNKLVVTGRWGGNIFHYPLTLLHCSMPDYILYRLLTIIGLMIACASIMVIIYRHIDQKLCWIFPSVFVLLAQIELEHDGLFAFGWSYQFDIALVFISVELFILFKSTQKRLYQVLSVVTYFLAIMSYEAFAAFGALLFVIDILYMYDKKNLKLRVLVCDLLPHFLAALSYTLSFVILSHFLPAGEDAAIGNEASVAGFIQTLKSFSIGLFPLRFRPYPYKQLIKYAFEISWKNLALWIIIIFFAKIMIDYIKQSKQISVKAYISYSVVSLLGMMLPNIVIAMTSKFQQWTINNGVRTFGTSYYSYFFLIFWFVVTVAFAYQRIKWEKSFTLIIFFVFIFTVRFTLSSNEYYLQILNNNQNRYEAFMDIIQSEYFRELPIDVQIYTDDYVGIHNDMNRLSNFASSVCEKRVKVLNDKTALDWNMPVYYLDYDQEIKGVYLFKMLADTVANEVYIQSKDSLGNYYGMFRSCMLNAMPLCVDGKLLGAYNMNVIMPALYTESKDVLIQYDGIDTEFFKIYFGHNQVDSSIISFDGIYGLEEWGRWSQKEFTIMIDNVNNVENCELTLILAPGIQKNTKLDMTYYGQNAQYDISSNGTELHLTIPLTTGINQIGFSSEAENIDVPADPRDMNMSIVKLDIDYDGNVYQYSK